MYSEDPAVQSNSAVENVYFDPDRTEGNLPFSPEATKAPIVYAETLSPPRAKDDQPVPSAKKPPPLPRSVTTPVHAVSGAQAAEQQTVKYYLKQALQV